MPSRPKKRAPSNRVYSSEVNARQAHFPSRRRSINRTNPTPPASRTRQQTLTQIDFVTKYVPQNDDVDLNYIEQEYSPKRKRRTTLPSRDAKTVKEEDGTSKRKRRKTLPAQDIETAVDEDESPEPRRRRKRTLPSKDTPSIIETRTRKRRRVKQEPESERNATSTITKERSNVAYNQPSPAKGELIPPRTPVTARKAEIPSSQSPADTPLSTQKTSLFRSPVRSPLKARSTNTLVPLKVGLTGTKLTGWHPKLEVKSSVSWENEDSQPLTVSPFLRTARDGEYRLGAPNFSKVLDSIGENERSQGALRKQNGTTEPFNNTTPTPQSVPFSKIEIRDSDDGDEDEDEEEEGKEVSSLNDMVDRTKPIENYPSQLPHSLEPTPNRPSPIEAALAPNTDVPLPHPHAEPPVSPPDSSSNRELTTRSRDGNALANGTTSQSSHPLFTPLSSAEAASAQLFNDLYRQTQTQSQFQLQNDEYTEDLDHPPAPTARLLDSQSQMGFICRDYTPTPPPLSPTAATAPILNKPECGHTLASRSLSSSPSNAPRTSQISTQSPVIPRKLPQQIALPGAPPNPSHLYPSQFSTQSQSPLPNPNRTALSALQPQPQPQHGPPWDSLPSLTVVGSEPTLPSLPRQDADYEQKQDQHPSSPRYSDADTDADADADFLPPQTFLQSSPLLAPSLLSSPLSSKIRLEYDSQEQEEGERQGERGTVDLSVLGEGDEWDGRVKTTSQFLLESMLDDGSQNLRFDMPPGFSSQLMDQD